MDDDSRAEMRELKALNKSELVQFLTEIGFRVHRGMSKLDLIEALVLDRQPDGSNPFDTKRDVIMKFLQKNWSKVSSQLGIRCHGDCYRHNDMQVLACWLNSETVLKGEKDK